MQQYQIVNSISQSTRHSPVWVLSDTEKPATLFINPMKAWNKLSVRARQAHAKRDYYFIGSDYGLFDYPQTLPRSRSSEDKIVRV